jgi:hypothetical protein
MYVFVCRRDVMPGSGALCYLTILAATFRGARTILSSLPGSGRLDHWRYSRGARVGTDEEPGIILSRREGGLPTVHREISGEVSERLTSLYDLGGGS